MTPIAFANPPRRILIVKPSAIGDVVHALPVLNLLRRRWPAARISWLLTPVCAGLLEGHALLDEVIRFDRRLLGRFWRSPSAAIRLRAFARDLRRRQFDLVVDLQGLFRSGWITWQTAAPVRVGFANARELSWVFYTHRVSVPAGQQHAVDRYLRVARFIGCADAPVEFPLGTDPQQRDSIAAMLPGEHARYAVLLPGSNWRTKQWPSERFAALVQPLRQRLGLTSVVAGGPDAAPLAARIPGAINLVGRTTLPQLVALLDRAALVIANDSGPMHVAAALGRPLVCVYGPTSPVRTGPYNRPESVVRLGLACSPCYARHCWHQRCLRELDIEPVLQRAQQQLTTPRGVDPIADSGALRH